MAAMFLTSYDIGKKSEKGEKEVTEAFRKWSNQINLKDRVVATEGIMFPREGFVESKNEDGTYNVKFDGIQDTYKTALISKINKALTTETGRGLINEEVDDHLKNQNFK
jgi:hypothetical protein